MNIFVRSFQVVSNRWTPLDYHSKSFTFDENRWTVVLLYKKSIKFVRCRAFKVNINVNRCAIIQHRSNSMIITVLLRFFFGDRWKSLYCCSKSMPRVKHRCAVAFSHQTIVTFIPKMHLGFQLQQLGLQMVLPVRKSKNAFRNSNDAFRNSSGAPSQEFNWSISEFNWSI